MKTALLVIDMQNDFICGSLPVKDNAGNKVGNQVIPTINKLINSKYYDMLIYTLDWHPKEHLSFYSNRLKRPFKRIRDSAEHGDMYDDVVFEPMNGSPAVRMTLWPVHCVAGTNGAGLHPQLKIKQMGVMLYKGTRADSDGYSAFSGHTERGKGLSQFLKDNNIERVDLCGLALDYCVVNTALDAKMVGLNVRIVRDGCRAIHPEKIKSLITNLQARGISIVESSQILSELI